MITVEKLEKGTYFDDAFKISFRYDPTTVAKVKELAERRYLPEDRAWEIPAHELPEDPDKGGRLYHITKAGCDLMAGRIIGAQSEAFKTKYAPVFGEEAPVEVVEEKQEEPQEKAYTVEEVAQILGCSERNVYRNIQSGKLEAVEREVMIPTLKKFVTEEALEKYKAGRAS